MLKYYVKTTEPPNVCARTRTAWYRSNTLSSPFASSAQSLLCLVVVLVVKSGLRSLPDHSDHDQTSRRSSDTGI